MIGQVHLLVINNFELGQAYKHFQVKPSLIQAKSDQNYPDNPDDPNRLRRWNLVGHWVKISLNQSQVFTGSFSAKPYPSFSTTHC